MRIIADLHHSVLYESLAMLFVDRAILGPVELSAWVDGHYVTQSGPQTEEFGRVPLAVTTMAIAAAGADIIIATVGGTRHRLRALADEVGALYVDHVANAWDMPIGKTVLRASVGPGEAGLTYHPEFHRVPWVPATGDRIGSFHASLQEGECGPLWAEAARSHPEYQYVAYGTAEAPLRPHEVAQARSDCLAQWHCKDADGYGFGVHEAFAAGRAVIGHRRHYQGKLAEPLFMRGVTYIEPGDSPDLGYERMGEMAAARFSDVVDFDAEADAVRAYLGARLP